MDYEHLPPCAAATWQRTHANRLISRSKFVEDCDAVA